jgi:hypothetical protein
MITLPGPLPLGTWWRGGRSAATLLPRGSSGVSSQYLGVGAGFAPAQAGNRKGLPLLFEKIHALHLLARGPPQTFN